MADATADIPVPETQDGVMRAADGTPLKQSLARALRRQKIRALLLISPLLLFIVITFLWPIAQMLWRSVENDIVSNTIPRTVVALEEAGFTEEGPPEAVFVALAKDLNIAVEEKSHTRLGSRLNYEENGMASLFRKSGRAVDDMGEGLADQFIALNAAWEEPATWVTLLADPAWIAAEADWAAQDDPDAPAPLFRLDSAMQGLLPQTADIYRAFPPHHSAGERRPPRRRRAVAHRLLRAVAGPVRQCGHG